MPLQISPFPIRFEVFLVGHIAVVIGGKAKIFSNGVFVRLVRSVFSEKIRRISNIYWLILLSPGDVSNFVNLRIGCKLTRIRILWPSLVSKWTLYYGCSSTLTQQRIASKRSLANGTRREKLFPTHQSMQHRKSSESIHYFPLLLPHLVEAFCIN